MRRARDRNGHDSAVQGRRSLTVRPAHIPRDVTGAGWGGEVESLSMEDKHLCASRAA